MSNPPQPRTVIVVPCFNEERRLRFAAFESYFSMPGAAHILFVDDGSRDSTLARLLAFQRSHRGSCSVAALPQNRGKAEAVRQGLLAAIDGGAEIVGYWDADLAVPLREIRLMEGVVSRDEETQIVIGIRLPLLGRRIRRDRLRGTLGRLSAFVTRTLTQLSTRDTQCGAKLFRVNEQIRRCLASRFSSRWLFDVELMLRLRAVHGDFEQIAYEVPLECWVEQPGSKVRPSSYLSSLWELLRLRWRAGIPATPTDDHLELVMQSDRRGLRRAA